MSEFLAEAAVLIRPDTTKFRATLVAELEAATRGIVVPVQVAAAAGAKTTVAANSASAASARQAAVATNELTVSRTRQIVADQTAAAEEAKVAEAQRLTAVAEGRLSRVAEAGVRSTTVLAAARAELRASNIAVTASERALDAALVTSSAATQTAAVETLRLSVAARAAALAAEAETVATARLAPAVATSAAAHEQLVRGAGATVLSMGGIRGATLAASGPFLAGAAAVTILAKAIKESNAETEAAARATRIFGSAEKALAHDAEGMAGTFGLSITEALKFEGAIGNVLQVAGIAQERIPALSERLVKLAADMAAFSNVPVADVLKTLQLAILGNTRGLKSLGVELSAATVNQEALRESGKRLTSDLTTQDRELARINLLFQQTANQQGAAAERSHSLAGETRSLRANLSDLGASIGSDVSPVIKLLVIDLNGLVSGLRVAGKGVTSLGTELGSLAERLVEALPGGSHVRDLFLRIDQGFRTSSDSAGALNESLRKQEEINRQNSVVWDALTGKVLGTAHSFEDFMRITNNLRFTQAEASLSSLSEHLLDLKFIGAPDTKILANLQEQIAAAQAEIATAPTVKARVAARQQRNQLKDQVDAIVAQQEQDAKDMAAKAQQGAQLIAQIIQDALARVKAAQDQADRAFLDMIGAAQGHQNLAQIRAEGTKSLVDDVAAQKELQSLLRKEIAAARATIIDAQLRAQTILDLTTKLLTTNNQLKALEAQQAANRQQRNQAKFDAKAESVDLDIQLAQTNKNLRGEIAARQRRIALDEERAKAVRGDTLAAKRLRNDIAAQRAAIDDLKKQLGQRNKDFQALSFEFLQAQQGFAANLISNLIPLGATAGLVGGGGITTPTGSAATTGTGAARAPRSVSAGLGEAAQTATPRGATTGQMTSLIEVNRNMLRVLIRLAGQRTHPEATNQKVAQSASMDILSW